MRAIWPTPTTLVQTFKRIEGFEPRGVGALQAYLRQAVLNRIRDELRRKGRRPDVTDLDGLELDRASSPLEQAIGQEAVERYERALERLKPEERAQRWSGFRWRANNRSSASRSPARARLIR